MSSGWIKVGTQLNQIIPKIPNYIVALTLYTSSHYLVHEKIISLKQSYNRRRKVQK